MDYPETMKAAVLFGFNDVRLVDRPVPSPGSDEVLIKVKSCGVCAGDIKMITRGMLKQPPFGEFILGHEYAGTIVQVGEMVDEFAVGDRVAVEVHKGCGRCRNCLLGKYTACLNYGDLAKGHRANGFTTMGGFAEYVVNHVNTVHKFSDDISFDEASTVTLAGTALYGIERAGGFVPGDTIVVLGPGSIGLICVQCCKALGAGTVILTGTRDDRLALGAKMGADQVINISRENPLERVRELTGGLGPNLVLVTTGMRDSLQQAIELAPRGTDIVLLAHLDDPVTVDIGLAVQKGNSIFTVRGEGRMSVSQALSLMAQGKITPKDLITHRFPLSRIREAIDTFVERRDGAIKVVVHPEEPSA
jgi:2-desacetyl-2-hydroxyethyl bacteriochlorophyllide A dehydrogenase